MKTRVPALFVFVTIGVVILMYYNSTRLGQHGTSIDRPDDGARMGFASNKNRGSQFPLIHKKSGSKDEGADLGNDSMPLLSDSEVLGRVGSVCNEFREVHELLMRHDVCRTNSKLALRLTFETCADLNNAFTVSQDVLNDIMWAEQSAQSRHLGMGYEMESPTKNPAILRAVSRIEEARKHRLSAVQRLERMGVLLNESERLRILTTDVNDSIGTLQNIIPKVDGLGD